MEEGHGQECEEESNVDSGQGLDPQCPEDAHVEAAGSCAQVEETAEGDTAPAAVHKRIRQREGGGVAG